MGAAALAMLLPFVVLVAFFVFIYMIDRDPKPPKIKARDYNAALRALHEVDALLGKIETETTDIVAKGYAAQARGKTSDALIRAIEKK